MQAILSAILDLTEQVQGAIDAGEWQRAQGLETARRAMLERLVAEHGSAAGLGSVLALLQHGNHRLIGVVEHHKRRVLREATTVRSAHAGVSLYAETDAAP